MARRRLPTIRLARKISLLFGTAVLLTITVTLLFPLAQMTNLDVEAMLMQANWVATAAVQAVDLHQPDWAAAQEELQHRWPLLVRETGLPPNCPQLVRVDPEHRLGRSAGIGPMEVEGFRLEAIDRLTRNPEQRYYWDVQDEGRRFRYAMAVRSHRASPHPQVLRGIIDVRLPIPPHNARWNLIVTVLAGATGAVLAILVFYTVTQRLVLTPVRTLRRAAEQVTSGDIDVRTSIRSRDEFQELSEAFNDMLAHLRSAQDELRKTNRSLDIRLGELAETNVALYESVRLKSQFLANMSHELRTPLVSIIGFAELLRDAWDNPKTSRERLARYADNILASGRGLLEIINDLLDLAKIEAGKMALHVSEFDLSALCNDLIDFVRPLADKRDQHLLLELEPDLPRCRSDSGKIKQILYNLLSNGIKFTPPGGAISLRVEGAGPDQVRMVVQDNGPGIPLDQRESIFEKFHQVDGSATREFQGTGLGLAISRELAHMMGGNLHLADDPPPGATFVLVLPLVAPAYAPVPQIRLS